MSELGADGDGAVRVALLAHRLAMSEPTGVGRYYRELAVALAEAADPDVVGYVVASPRETPRETETLEWVVPPLRHASLGGPRLARHAAWCALRRPTVDRALGRPALVHTLHPWAPTPTRAPLVVTVHDLMPVVHPEWHRRDERFGLQRGLAYAHDHAALIVVASSWTGDLVRHHLGIGPERVVVVPEGVGAEFRQHPSTATIAETCRRYGVEPGRYLVTVGAVAPRKNLLTVVRALARVAPATIGTPALLVVGPSGRGAAAVRDEVDRLGLTQRVRFAGYVPGVALPTLLAGALALVHPSLDEGFGLTPLEAMAAGTAVLASNAGSLPEVVGDGGVLLVPDDADAWAGAIEAVATDDEHRDAVVAAGARHQARFTWEATARATMAAHLEVLQR